VDFPWFIGNKPDKVPMFSSCTCQGIRRVKEAFLWVGTVYRAVKGVLGVIVDGSGLKQGLFAG